MPELPPLNSVDWKKMRGNGSVSGPSWSVIARCGHWFLRVCTKQAYAAPRQIQAARRLCYEEGLKAGCYALAGSTSWTICYWQRS